MKKCLATLIFLLVALPASALTPPAWKTTRYALAPGDMEVRDVLTDLQRTLGIGVEMTRDVQGTVSSSGEATTVEAFLDRLAASQGLSWFVFRNRLYVSRESESEEVHIATANARAADVRSYLSGIKLFEEKFGWIEMPSRNEVAVVGPMSYVKLVKEHAARVSLSKPPRQPVAEPMTTMTFRLRYANAADIPATALGGMPVPGVASLLSRLYGGDNRARSAALGRRSVLDVAKVISQRETDAARAARPSVSDADRRANANLSPDEIVNLPAPLAIRPRPYSGESMSEAAERQYANDVDGTGGLDERGAFANGRRAPEEQPSIEADSRLNMIIVRDKPSRREEYAKLIAELDISTAQFVLDAVVIELDTTAMGVLSATLASQPVRGPTDSAIVVPRSAAEALYPALRTAKRCDRGASLVSQAVVFKENDSFALNFTDNLLYPELSTPFWYSLASKLVPLPQEPADKARKIGLKLAGSARAAPDHRIELRLELSEGRESPNDGERTMSQRATDTSLTIELAEEEALLLVDGVAWSGGDMKSARSRMVVLSARRWSRGDAPTRLIDAGAVFGAASATPQAGPACTTASSSYAQ